MENTSDWFEEEKTVVHETVAIETTGSLRAISYSVGSFEEEEFKKFHKKYGHNFRNAQVVWESKQCSI